MRAQLLGYTVYYNSPAVLILQAYTQRGRKELSLHGVSMQYTGVLTAKTMNIILAVQLANSFHQTLSESVQTARSLVSETISTNALSPCMLPNLFLRVQLALKCGSSAIAFRDQAIASTVHGDGAARELHRTSMILYINVYQAKS